MKPVPRCGQSSTISGDEVPDTTTVVDDERDCVPDCEIGDRRTSTLTDYSLIESAGIDRIATGRRQRLPAANADKRSERGANGAGSAQPKAYGWPATPCRHHDLPPRSVVTLTPPPGPCHTGNLMQARFDRQ
jgi:hypothetical protein